MANCPFCMNSLNEGASACGHCGAFLRISPLSTIRKIVFIGTLLLSLLLVFAGSNFGKFVGLVGCGLSLWGIVHPSKIEWAR